MDEFEGQDPPLAGLTPEEYLDTIADYFREDNWNVSANQVNESVVLLACVRLDPVSGDRQSCLCLVETSPDGTISTDHLKYLLKAAQSKGVDDVRVASRGGLTDQAERVAREYDVTVLDSDTIASSLGLGLSFESEDIEMPTIEDQIDKGATDAETDEEGPPTDEPSHPTGADSNSPPNSTGHIASSTRTEQAQDVQDGADPDSGSSTTRRALVTLLGVGTLGYGGYRLLTDLNDEGFLSGASGDVPSPSTDDTSGATPTTAANGGAATPSSSTQTPTPELKASPAWSDLTIQSGPDIQGVIIKNTTNTTALSVPFRIGWGGNRRPVLTAYHVPPKMKKQYRIDTPKQIKEALIEPSGVNYPHPVFKGGFPTESDKIARPIRSDEWPEFTLPVKKSATEVTYKASHTKNVEISNVAAKKKNGRWVVAPASYLDGRNGAYWNSVFEVTVRTLDSKNTFSVRFPKPSYDLSLDEISTRTEEGVTYIDRITVTITAKSKAAPEDPRVAVLQNEKGAITQEIGDFYVSKFHSQIREKVTYSSPYLIGYKVLGNAGISPKSGAERVGKSKTVTINTNARLNPPFKTSARFGVFLTGGACVADYTWIDTNPTEYF